MGPLCQSFERSLIANAFRSISGNSLSTGTDLSSISHAQLDPIPLRLNQRPRKTLVFQTPASKLQASVASTISGGTTYRPIGFKNCRLSGLWGLLQEELPQILLVAMPALQKRPQEPVSDRSAHGSRCPVSCRHFHGSIGWPNTMWDFFHRLWEPKIAIG